MDIPLSYFRQVAVENQRKPLEDFLPIQRKLCSIFKSDISGFFSLHVKYYVTMKICRFCIKTMVVGVENLATIE